MDLHRPFTTATERRKLLFMAVISRQSAMVMDYFTIWLETESMANKTWKNINNFVWRPIIPRFGVPQVIITNNGPYFDCKGFKDFSINGTSMLCVCCTLLDNILAALMKCLLS